MTVIEAALFMNGRPHYVSGVQYSGDTLVIRLHPSDREDLTFDVTFTQAELFVKDPYSNPTPWRVPWDIIWFDATPIGEGRWEYCLHTDSGDFMFVANWPSNTPAPEQNVSAIPSSRPILTYARTPRRLRILEISMPVWIFIAGVSGFIMFVISFAPKAKLFSLTGVTIYSVLITITIIAAVNALRLTRR